MSIALPTPRSTFIDLFVTRSLAADAVLITAGAALTALSAQIAIPLWPVPVTGQTFAALLVGSVLGGGRGALSMLLYAAVGVLGMPVFSGGAHGIGAVLGTTGGYILGLVLGAAVAGTLARRGWDRRLGGAVLVYAIGLVCIFAPGLIWLSATTGAGLAQTLEWGLYPFVIGEVLKVALAAAVIRTAWFASARRRPRA